MSRFVDKLKMGVNIDVTLNLTFQVIFNQATKE